jgi:hypothetical protein
LYDTRAAGLGLTITGSILTASAAAELAIEIWLLQKRVR